MSKKANNSFLSSAVCGLALTLPLSALASPCNDEHAQVLLDSDEKGLFIYQDGFKKPVKIPVQNRTEKLKKIDTIDHVEVSAKKPYCLFFPYSSQNVDIGKYRQYGFVFASHYFYISDPVPTEVYFKDFGAERDLILSVEDYDTLFSSKAKSEDLRFEFNHLLKTLSLKDSYGGSLRVELGGERFNAIFKRSAHLAKKQYQLAFEFTRFTEKQDGKRRVLRKLYKERVPSALAEHQISFGTLIGLDIPDQSGPLFWVVKYRFPKEFEK